ncbi:glycoside hydrolase family 3 N-terminal domain-containing protein [Thermodesulfobacteriota bacterium]
MNIESFSAEQIAGQRLMVGFEGTGLNQDLKFYIDTIKVGGIILFSRNIDNPEQIGALCQSVQAYARACGQPPIFIAIDQEGGTVARLKQPFTQFSGNPKMRRVEDAVNFARVTAKELASIGINMNMAPVLDIAPQGRASIMANRVFGHDPLWVSELGAAVVEHLQQCNIMAVAKHFPGIGRTTQDSHFDRLALDIDIGIMESSDLLPFATAIKNDVAGIMLSHILYTRIDAAWPASLSVRIAKDLLRGSMKFDGIVITDDLDMGAIVKQYDIHTVMKQIVSADIDIALICHPGPKIEAAFDVLREAASGVSSPALNGIESAKRILTQKRKYLAGINQM